MSAMQVVPMLRREVARQFLSELGRGIAFDAVPSPLRRSRKQHLRNGVGGLVTTSGNLVFRSVPAIAFSVSRKKARTDLRYAAGELMRAGRPETARQRAAVAAAAAAGLAVGVALAIRARRARPAVEPSPETVESRTSPEPVAAGVAE
jgi:hypothetical protein